MQTHRIAALSRLFLCLIALGKLQLQVSFQCPPTQGDCWDLGRDTAPCCFLQVKALEKSKMPLIFTSGDAIITVLHGQRYLLLQTDVWGGTRGDLWAQVWGRRLHRCPGVKHYANAARAVSRASSRVAGRLGAVSGRCISEIIRKTVGPGWEQSRGSQRRIKFQMEERGWKSLMIWGLEIASTLDFFF